MELAARVNTDAAQPSDLVNDPAFSEGVRLLSADSYSLQNLVEYARGNNEVLAMVALEAARQRERNEEICASLLEGLGNAGGFEQWFYLRTLAAHSTQPLIGDVLFHIGRDRHVNWLNFLSAVDTVRNFVAERLEAGEVPSFANRLQQASDSIAQHLRAILDKLALPGLAPLTDELQTWMNVRIDREFLASIGKLWTEQTSRAASEVIEHDALRACVQELLPVLSAERRRSLLLVGELGVGKTSTARVLLRQLHQQGWEVFEASSADLIAGMKYMGEFEARVQQLVRELQNRRIVWVVSDFPRLAWVGRHEFSQFSAIDYILPFVERGELFLVGEAEPGAYERLLQMRPRCSTALHTIRVLPMDANDTLALAKTWIEQQGPQLASERTLQEAWDLSQQFLGDSAAPGNLLGFLSLTLQRLRSSSSHGAARISTDDLIVTLTKLTGLPETIIDDRQQLDLHSLRQHFESRVLGQQEAVDCLVERIAMIKAGVTDPSRPSGVFLLAGPTGTGKTELAKTLAAFLFGSPQRMIRLDMSELQTPEALSRVFGEGRTTDDGRSFVDQIRKQPFSVVLLDEFEKAHPNVWDLFLQVFDDGRLTDRQGRVADFRQAVILMTSNLGALVPTGTSLGFVGGSKEFQAKTVIEAIEKAFRREFINRIDRIVVMHPLGRDTMRQILVKQLEDIFRRRGLRNRAWAVEWDDAALEFLLEKGFTRDLGARPLKRAIERYFLSPLAVTIVNHQYPKGDQFLFVKTDGKRLVVEFVDPDAPGEPVGPEAGHHHPAAAGIRAEALVMGAQGNATELACLENDFTQLKRIVERSSWAEEKERALQEMASPDFWKSPARFEALGHAEYVDRIEAGVRRSGSLLQRVMGSSKRDRYPRDLVQRLAQQLYLLDVACRDALAHKPREAFLRVEALRGAGIAPEESDALAFRLARMYRQWASLRGMHVEVLEDGHSDAGYRFSMAVSGYGAHSILANESGLHVFERPEAPSGHGFVRHQARVRVVPQPAEPSEGPDALRRAADTAFAHAAPERTIVRRYRELPAPLVRDGVRGWRSGRVDLVFDGHFDVIGALSEQAVGDITA